MIKHPLNEVLREAIVMSRYDAKAKTQVVIKIVYSSWLALVLPMSTMLSAVG